MFGVGRGQEWWRQRDLLWRNEIRVRGAALSIAGALALVGVFVLPVLVILTYLAMLDTSTYGWALAIVLFAHARRALKRPPFAPRGAIPPLPQVRRGFDVRFVQGGALLLG
ncbi:MAG: hypothetical protein QM607_08695, partial [Microbacterium sp.]